MCVTPRRLPDAVTDNATDQQPGVDGALHNVSEPSPSSYSDARVDDALESEVRLTASS